MRLTTTLLSALFAVLFCGGTAKADGTVSGTATPLADLDDGYYVLKGTTRGLTGYLTHLSSSSSNAPFRVLKADATPTSADYIWYVSKSDNGMVFFNCGTKLWLSAVNERGGVMNADGSLSKAGVYAGETYTNYTYGAPEGGFVLYQKNSLYDGQKNYLHGQSNVSNGAGLGFWTGDNTAVSGFTCVAFQAYKVTDFECADLQKAYGISLTEGSTTTVKAALDGSSLVETPSGYENVLYYGQNVTSGNPVVSKTNTTFTIQSNVLCNYDSNAYYRIRSINKVSETNRYFSTEKATAGTDGSVSAAASVIRLGATDKLVPQLWKLESTGTELQYKLYNANLGQYVANVTSTAAITSTTGDGSGAGVAELTLCTSSFDDTEHFEANDSKSLFLMKINGHRINACGGAGTEPIGDYNGNHDKDAGNYWRFFKVTEVPVTIDATMGWASVCFPFATQLPDGSGVTAYKADKAANGMLSLSEVTGVIPAGEGVLLMKDGGAEVNMQIVASSDATLSGNLFEGATAKRTGFATASNYFLGKNSKDEAAFLKGNFDTAPCNKAYLPATKVTTSDPTAETAVLSFTFSGDTTGIDTAATQSAESRAVKYYDLSGRRVLFPANGVFVTDKGEKVYVK